MISDPDLAVVLDRAYWSAFGDNAVQHAPPGAQLAVLVQLMRVPTRRGRYVATLRRGQDAMQARPGRSVAELVSWAERVPLADSPTSSTS